MELADHLIHSPTPTPASSSSNHRHSHSHNHTGSSAFCVPTTYLGHADTPTTYLGHADPQLLCPYDLPRVCGYPYDLPRACGSSGLCVPTTYLGYADASRARGADDAGAANKASDIRSHVGSSIAPDNELVLAMSTTVIVSMSERLQVLERQQHSIQDSILQLQMTQLQQGNHLQLQMTQLQQQQQGREMIAEQGRSMIAKQQQQYISLCWLGEELKQHEKLQQHMVHEIGEHAKFRSAAMQMLHDIEQQVHQMQIEQAQQQRACAAPRADATERAGLQLQLLQQQQQEQQQRDRMQQCQQQQQPGEQADAHDAVHIPDLEQSQEPWIEVVSEQLALIHQLDMGWQ